MRRKPVTFEVVDEASGRFVVATYPDGEIIRTAVSMKKPARKPRRPLHRLRTDQLDRTKKKKF
jgi:hypothetical protein